jgi:hypothetical protein
VQKAIIRDGVPIGAPKDWDPTVHGQCEALFVRAEVVNGLPRLLSAWEVEQHEAALLLAGAKVHLGIVSASHPPVNLSVSDLPESFEPVVTARRFHCPVRGQVARVEALFALAPAGLRIFAERPIVAGFAVAFASALEAVEKLAKERGCDL